jgi:DNA-3-methyladenine glycosylase I
MENEWSYEICNDDNALFEKLCLEGAQSGLSWRTILNKRQAYRDAFHGFDILKVSQMTSSDIDDIMSSDSSNSNGNSNSVKKSKNDIVVRHRGKLESVIHNAKQILIMLEQKSNDNDDDDDNNNRQSQSQEAYKYTSFSNYLWSFVNYKPILNKWSNFDEIPSSSNESETMSRGLKSRGFKFVGPTTCYSLMQSCGFVIDHPVDTPQWSDALKRLQERKGGYQSVQKGE